MKRIISILAVLALVLSAACAAFADGQDFTTAYFTLKLPENWIIDTEDLEKKEGEESLGFFGDDREGGLVGAAYLVYYEELKDFALWNADEQGLQAYTDTLLEEFADLSPVSLGTVMAGKVPLVLIRCSDEEGEFVYADTVTNGYTIQFEFYVPDDETEKMLPVTDECIEQIKAILETFAPVGA